MDDEVHDCTPSSLVAPFPVLGAASCSAPMNTPASLTWAWRWCASVWRAKRPAWRSAGKLLCAVWPLNNAILSATTIPSNISIKVSSTTCFSHATTPALPTIHPQACSISDLKPGRRQQVLCGDRWRSTGFTIFMGLPRVPHTTQSHVLFPTCTVCFDDNTGSVKAPQDL